MLHAEIVLVPPVRLSHRNG